MREWKLNARKIMNLFIDANIYLNYFKMSSENIDSLEELLKILKTKKKLKLLLPEQTLQEYSRNRDNIVNETKMALKEQKNFKPILPPMVRSWSEAGKIKRLFKELNSYYERIIKKHDKELKNESSKLDKVINEIFDKAIKVLEEDNIINKAFYRMLKGNPPGKKDSYWIKDSYGDAIVWESILDKRTNDNLAIVTDDNDWKEQHDKENLNRFLLKEWQKKTKKRIKVYSSLGKFINDFEKKPTIKKETIEREERLGSITNINQGSISIVDTASAMAMGGIASSPCIFPPSGPAFMVPPSGVSPFANPPLGSIGYFSPQSSGLKISTKKECPNCKSKDVFNTNIRIEETLIFQGVRSIPIYECKKCGEKFIVYE